MHGPESRIVLGVDRQIALVLFRQVRTFGTGDTFGIVLALQRMETFEKPPEWPARARADQPVLCRAAVGRHEYAIVDALGLVDDIHAGRITRAMVAFRAPLVVHTEREGTATLRRMDRHA